MTPSSSTPGPLDDGAATPALDRTSRVLAVGELPNVVRGLRRLLGAVDDARFLLDASMREVDEVGGLEDAADSARRATSEAAAHVYRLLRKLEAHPSVIAYRHGILASRAPLIRDTEDLDPSIHPE